MEDTSGPNSLPDYPMMIIAAIEALGEKEGANESAISSYIESNNSVPGDHSALLSNNLEKMKESGQLVLSNGNYLKPDLDAPPKRGRGRPRKSTVTPPPPATGSGSTRSRGRPPKPKDLSAPAPEPKKAAGRPRGRQPKKVETAAPVAGVKRGRGRPPKVRPAATLPAATVGA